MTSSDQPPRHLSPCDTPHVHAGTRIHLSGRVCQTNGETLVICDAFRSVLVELDQDTALPPLTSLVEVRGIWTGDHLENGTVQEVHPRAFPAAVAHEHNRLHERGVAWRLRARAQLFRTIRAWFEAQDFLEVDTPQRVPSPGLDLHLDAFPTGSAFLITSPEYQMKRLLAGGIPRLFQLVHCFRQSETGSRHNSEFMMLEWYRGFSNWLRVMNDTEQLVASVARELTGSTTISYQGRQLDLAPPYPRITVTEAFDRYAGISAETCLSWAEQTPDKFFETLVDKVEPGLAEQNVPVFLTAFPASQASLARLMPGDPRVCERFELYVGGMELCNGFGELTDPVEQLARLRRDQQERMDHGKPAYPIDNGFLDGLRGGMPPSAGNAMGLDRLLMLCTNSSTMEQVLAFPDSWI